MRSILLVALSSAFLFAPARDAIRFAPAEGLALRKTFHRSYSTELDSTSHVSDGEPAETARDQSSKGERKLVVTDRYAAVDGARVTRLARTFDEVALEDHHALSSNGESHRFDSTAESELAGETVVFEWDEEAEEYAVRAEDGELDEDLLEDLRFDLDGLLFLPADEVAEGDEWTLDVEELQRFLKPEKDLPLEWRRERNGEEIEAEEQGDDESPEPAESIGGEVTARYGGTREVEGVSLAVIHVSGEIVIETKSEGEQESDHGSSSYSSEQTMTLSIEGECLWNQAGGHLHSLELAAELAEQASSEGTFSFGEEEHSFESESASSGTGKYEVAFEAVE